MDNQQVRITRHSATSLSQPATPQAQGGCLVLFGATGDLARRKLFPALARLEADRLLPGDLTVVATARSKLERHVFLDLVHQALVEFGDPALVPKIWQRLAERIDYAPLDRADPQGFTRLGQAIAAGQHGSGSGNRLYYLATPPSTVPGLLDNLNAAGLLTRSDPQRPTQCWDRVIFEKPFGRDLQSSLALNQQAARHLDEQQIFRIDHYLGKETVQNILVLRFANAIFEPLWNRKYVSQVQITAAERIGVEGRGAFYDEAGALRDIIQNHLLQVLSLVAMEAPVGFSADAIRDEKVKVFRSLRPLDPGAVVRGQYRGYLDEPGVGAGSRTETFLALSAHIDNWRWQGVPFYLRAGKQLTAKRTEVAVFFQPVPHCLFGDPNQCALLPGNHIKLRIQPDEGIALRFASKIPGPDLTVGGFDMDFRYAGAVDRRPREAYERLLLNALQGDATLFARRDGVEESWRYVQPVLDAWAAKPDLPVQPYDPDSAGPQAAAALPARDGHQWLPLT